MSLLHLSRSVKQGLVLNRFLHFRSMLKNWSERGRTQVSFLWATQLMNIFLERSIFLIFTKEPALSIERLRPCSEILLNWPLYCDKCPLGFLKVVTDALNEGRGDTLSILFYVHSIELLTEIVAPRHQCCALLHFGRLLDWWPFQARGVVHRSLAWSPKAGIFLFLPHNV